MTRQQRRQQLRLAEYQAVCLPGGKAVFLGGYGPDGKLFWSRNRRRDYARWNAACKYLEPHA